LNRPVSASANVLGWIEKQSSAAHVMHFALAVGLLNASLFPTHAIFFPCLMNKMQTTFETKKKIKN